MKKIVTHPGTAHGDDFLACCILTAKFGIPIERREPTADDLDDDQDTIVLDVGGKYEVSFFNFDHHQDANLPCSLVLVLKWLGLHEKFQRAYRWYDNVDFRDRRGAKALGEKYGLKEEQMIELGSPVHTAMLKLFEKRKNINPMSYPEDENHPCPLYWVMAEIGQEFIDGAEKYDAAWKQLEICERRNIRGHEVLINPSDDITATGGFARLHKLSVMVSHDNRGAGWAILRCADGEKSFDFSRIASDPRVEFAHKGGFIAKTKEMIPVDQIIELIGLAVKQ